MNLMTAGALFCFNYLTEVLPSFKISLNLSSWNGHITPSLTETIYQAPFSLMCFTETASYGANFKDIQSYKNNWKPFHKFTSHNHVICYQTCKISFVEEFPITLPTEILPALFRAVDTHVLIILIYQPLGSIGTFIADLIEA